MTDQYDDDSQGLSRDTHSETELLRLLEDDLSNLVARHVRWMNGQTFQEMALRVAAGYFDESELTPYIPFDLAADTGSLVVDAIRRASKV